MIFNNINNYLKHYQIKNEAISLKDKWINSKSYLYYWPNSFLLFLSQHFVIYDYFF